MEPYGKLARKVHWSTIPAKAQASVFGLTEILTGDPILCQIVVEDFYTKTVVIIHPGADKESDLCWKD